MPASLLTVCQYGLRNIRKWLGELGGTSQIQGLASGYTLL
jgi:hypothetical protein